MFSLVHELCEVHMMMSCAFQEAEAAEEEARTASQAPAAAAGTPLDAVNPRKVRLVDEPASECTSTTHDTEHTQ